MTNQIYTFKFLLCVATEDNFPFFCPKSKRNLAASQHMVNKKLKICIEPLAKYNNHFCTFHYEINDDRICTRRACAAQKLPKSNNNNINWDHVTLHACNEGWAKKIRSIFGEG